MENSLVQVWSASECPEELKRHLDDLDLLALVSSVLVSELSVPELLESLNMLVRGARPGCEQRVWLRPNGDLQVSWHH